MSLAALRRGELAGARALKLDCGLTELPEEVLGLADTLEVLDLSGNSLTSLPADFARLGKLRVLFCSGNRFERLPPVLGECAALSQIGFRGSGLREVPAEALPSRLRWLTLTGNVLESVPAELGKCAALQKLMLAGNRLSALPESLAGASSLELLRLSSNRFERLPGWLVELPRLAWLAWAANAFDRDEIGSTGPEIDWSDLVVGERIGEGASGLVYRAEWNRAGGLAPRMVALKLFKSAMTSDGAPASEMRACLEAGEQASLLGGIGRLVGHPAGQDGLLMPLLDADWRPLAGPPSLESCSRDVYDPLLRLAPEVVVRIAGDVARAACHMQESGYAHGDLYAHNVLWDGVHGKSVLSDFGAASRLAARELCKIDVLAWGILVGELMSCCLEEHFGALSRLMRACVGSIARQRPTFEEIVNEMGSGA